MSSTETDRASAYHEAGHAVALHFLPACEGVRSVSIVGDADTTGQTRCSCWHPDGVPRHDPLLASQQIQACLAGAIAEELATGESDDDAMREDLEIAIRIARSRLHGEHAEAVQAIVDRCAREVQALLRARWWAVEAVAAALASHGRLEADEFLEVVERATRVPTDGS